MKNQLIVKTVRADIRFFMQENNASNVFHVEYAGTIGETDLDHLFTYLADWIAASWAPLVSVEYTANEILLTDMDTLAGFRKAYPITPPTPGVRDILPVPANATIAVKASVGHRGRGTNGRVFWFGLNVDQIDGNEVTPATAAAIVDALEALRVGIPTVTPFTSLVVPHLIVNKVPQNPAHVEEITEFLLSDSLVDTQKDRLPFHKKKRKPKTTPAP